MRRWKNRKLLLGMVGILLLCLCGGVGGLTVTGEGYIQRYSGRIYPGVNVYGVSLGGQTPVEAGVTLRSEFSPTAQLLTLRDGERIWHASWADLALDIDAAATAQLAYRVGREGSAVHQHVTRWRTLFFGHRLSPVVILPDARQLEAALQAFAPQVWLPPQDADLIITPEGVSPVPSQPGLALDLEAMLSYFPYAISSGPDGIIIEVLTRPVSPTVTDVGAAQAYAEQLLVTPLTMLADDPLTAFRASWTVTPTEVIPWLTTRIVRPPESAEARLVVTVREEPLRAYLKGLADRLSTSTDLVTLEVEDSLAAVRATVEAGGFQAPLVFSHPPRTYFVQPGDTLSSIAYAHGFPVWRLEQANPGIADTQLRPGQPIVIPSLDVLFPFPLITDRRIVVDLSDQRVYAYEGERLVYDFVASTGIPSSPTIPGVFQILSKEEEAYASSWDLWMPHFMGIYYTAPDFTNGIHALPTLSNGTRLWEGVLGRPVSYGCIVLGIADAVTLYRWADLGVLVVIRE